MLSMLTTAFLTIYEDREAEMVNKIDIFDEVRRPPGNVTFDRFDNSLNFFWGIANYSENWDSLNNPYVRFHGHQFYQGGSAGMKFANFHEL